MSYYFFVKKAFYRLFIVEDQIVLLFSLTNTFSFLSYLSLSPFVITYIVFLSFLFYISFIISLSSFSFSLHHTLTLSFCLHPKKIVPTNFFKTPGQDLTHTYAYTSPPPLFVQQFQNKLASRGRNSQTFCPACAVYSNPAPAHGGLGARQVKRINMVLQSRSFISRSRNYHFAIPDPQLSLLLFTM